MPGSTTTADLDRFAADLEDGRLPSIAEVRALIALARATLTGAPATQAVEPPVFGEESLEALLARAGMNEFDYNTGVVRGTDKSGRVLVGRAADPAWGDCVGVAYMREGEQGWRFTHLSPARARIMSRHLLRCADVLETGDAGIGMACIDG